MNFFQPVCQKTFSRPHEAARGHSQGVATCLSGEFHANLFIDDLEDEFGDVDNELEGLTILEPMNEVALFEFCTGYGVL